jgi:hypothetical protein
MAHEVPRASKNSLELHLVDVIGKEDASVDRAVIQIDQRSIVRAVASVHDNRLSHLACGTENESR